jgi:hypothetical protein
VPDDTTRKELTARLDPELYEQLREATFKLRISKNQAMIEALKMWLGSNSSSDAGQVSHVEKDIPKDLRPVVDWLTRLWAHKSTLELESLKTSLKALAASSQTERKGRSTSAL